MTFHERALALGYAASYANPLRSIRVSKEHRRAEALPEAEEIAVVLAFDTEYTPPWVAGTWERNGEDVQASKGLHNVLALTKELGAAGTFLVEGVFARENPRLVESVVVGEHEVGYHGFSHESYGGFWRTNTGQQPRVLAREDVLGYISRGKELIQDMVGKAPTSFVAPFHHMRKSTLTALGQLGFTADSSVYNHVYGLGDPFEISLGGSTIVEIPFGVAFPVNRLGFSPFFPTVLEAYRMDEERTIGSVTRVVRRGSRSRHLLLTCHPWEFFDPESVQSSSLRSLLTRLVETGRVNWKTMSEVAADYH